MSQQSNITIVDFFKGDKVGASPAQAKKDIHWTGTLFRGTLRVKFEGKFGWEMKRAVLNGKEFSSKNPDHRVGNDPNLIIVDAKHAIRKGENTLSVYYTHPFSAHFGDRTELSAELEIGAVIPNTNISIPSVVSTENPGVVIDDISKSLANATTNTIIILAIIAIISIAIAVILSRLGLLGKVVSGVREATRKQ